MTMNSPESAFQQGINVQQGTNYQNQYMNNGGQPALGAYSSTNNQPTQMQTQYSPMNLQSAYPRQPMSRDQYLGMSNRGPGARDYRRMLMERARRRYMGQGYK